LFWYSRIPTSGIRGRRFDPLQGRKVLWAKDGRRIVIPSGARNLALCLKLLWTKNGWRAGDHHWAGRPQSWSKTRSNGKAQKANGKIRVTKRFSPFDLCHLNFDLLVAFRPLIASLRRTLLVCSLGAAHTFARPSSGQPRRAAIACGNVRNGKPPRLCRTP